MPKVRNNGDQQEQKTGDRVNWQPRGGWESRASTGNTKLFGQLNPPFLLYPEGQAGERTQKWEQGESLSALHTWSM